MEPPSHQAHDTAASPCGTHANSLSGAFVEHAQEMADKMNPGDVMLLSNEYI
jgi:hypothetical protein